MAEYTIELKDVVSAGHNIFDFSYPFYDEKKRPEFEQHFIKHFYFREIGAETIDRFKVYLEDKMNVVFPYYNKLFEAAQVQYDLLNNYNLTEEFKTERDTVGKSAGVSSTVGQLHGVQESETQENRVVDTVAESDTVGKDTEKETTNTTTEKTGHSETATLENAETDGTNSATVKGSNSRNSKEKFLDTPQGLTDLTNSNYLTSLKEIDETGNNSQETNGTTHDETAKTGSEETDTTENGESDTTRNLERNSTVNQDSTGKETTNDKINGTVTDEQKTTQDNNTRMYSKGKEIEKHTLTRIGNIGVQTGADMMRIHVELQKTLAKIERMFFDECEDLFMLVY